MKLAFKGDVMAVGSRSDRGSGIACGVVTVLELARIHIDKVFKIASDRIYYIILLAV